MKEIMHAYSQRAAEYVTALGSIEDMDVLDSTLILEWGSRVSGPILDAGAGPGHWTELLRINGKSVQGVDIVQEFVESAQARFPHSEYLLGDIMQLPFDDIRFGGIISWYSLIHMDPEQARIALKEFARVLRPEGNLLIGVFLGPQSDSFDHAIAKAYFWSIRGINEALEAAGFHVIETHTRTTPRARPHLAVLAQRKADPAIPSGRY